MRSGLRVMGTMALSLIAPPWTWGQSPAFVPPPPGTRVAPLDIPAHVVPAPPERTDKPAGRRFINTTTALVEYRYDTFGPSGIGKVEIYMTSDRGVSWTKLGEDADMQSPATVQFPGQGLYGLRMAITNGNGFGGGVPRPGDPPQLFVEVDTMTPYVALHPFETVPKQGAIDLRWTAKDANLAPEPVSIFYRTRREAAWKPVAQNVKNDGVYRWVLPRDIEGQLYLKLEVADLAGNTTKLETPTPLPLDQSEPEATLLEVTPRSRSQADAPASVSIPAANLPRNPMPDAMLPPTSIPPTLPASLPTLPATLPPPRE